MRGHDSLERHDHDGASRKRRLAQVGASARNLARAFAVIARAHARGTGKSSVERGRIAERPIQVRVSGPNRTIVGRPQAAAKCAGPESLLTAARA